MAEPARKPTEAAVTKRPRLVPVKGKPSHTPTESAETYEAWAVEMTDSHLLCRDIGHSWRPFRAAMTAYGYERVLRCPRCKTERLQTLDFRGHVISGHYDYPEGYLAPRGMGRLDGDARDSLRLESIGRLVAKEDD